MIKQNVWQLFWNTFQLGDEVILITDEDKFAAGELTYVDEDGLRIKVKWKTEFYFKWPIVKFIAKEGFPVKILMGADGSSSIEQGDSEVTIGKIRELSREIENKRYKLEELRENTKDFIRESLQDDLAEPTHIFVSGDPFFIEDVSARIFNPGVEYIENEMGWDDNLYEETIHLKHKNGAIGLLWDISTIYYFE